MNLNVGSVIANLRLDDSKFAAGLTTATTKLEAFSKKAGQVGTYLTLRFTAPIVYAIKKSIQSFAAFDDAITRSAAVTRDMTDVMRKAMAETAISISKKSILGATELAQGYFALGQAGYTAAQSIKALPVVTDCCCQSSKIRYCYSLLS